MTQIIKNTITIVTLLLVSMGAVAGGEISKLNVTLDGNASTEAVAGTVTYSNGEITVTPASGNYLTIDDLTVIKTISGDNAQTRNPSINTPLELTAKDATADPSGETKYTFTIPGEEYDYEITANFHTRTNVENATVEVTGGPFTYSGEAIKPKLTVKVGSENLTAGTDYDAYYKDSINAGDGKIIIVGIRKYSGTKGTWDAPAATYTIEKADIKPVVSITGWTYGDTANEPKVTEGNPGNGEVSFAYKAKDATDEKYDENVPEDAGEYTVRAIVEETDNYKGGQATADFTISAKTIANATIELSEENLVFNGENQKPEVSVKDGETELELDKDYSLTNEGGTDVGEYTVTITGKGNYDSKTTASKKFSITALETTPTVTQTNPDEIIVYDGTAKEPSMTVTVILTDGGDPTELTTDDYDIAYSDNVNAGENTAKATVTLKHNYKGTATAAFSIAQADFAEVEIAAIDDQPYTGLAIEPTVSVTFNGKEVDAGEYSVSYAGNTDLGEATVTLTSTGKNFSTANTIETHFQIVAAQVTITATDKTVTYNGKPQAYDGASTEKGDIEIRYYASEEERSVGDEGIGEPIDANTYYVKVIQADEHYTSEPAYATFTIEQAEITEITLDQTELVFTGEKQTVNVVSVKAGELEVSSNFYEVSGNTGTEAGEYTVTVTAKDIKDNNFKGSATAKFVITHRTITADMIGFAEGQTTATYYNNTEDFYLPDGIVAYIITGISGTSLTAARISYIPKATPVLVELTTSSETAVDNPSGNMLIGAAEDMEVSSIAGGTVYVLYMNKFVKTTSGSIPASRCYLVISDGNAGTRSFDISHGEGYGTTGMGVLAAGTATVTKLIEGNAAEATDPGTVTYENGTITVTPANGFYLTAEDLTVINIIDGGKAQTRTTELSSPITIKATDPNADPSGVTTYTFEVTDESYAYEITANFHSRTDISKATVSPAEDIFTYTGEAIKPDVTVTLASGETLTLPTDYTVEYSNNINVGAGSIDITGKGKYIGKANGSFNITQKEVTVTADDKTKTYGEEDPELTATVDGTIGKDQVSYTISREEGEDVGEYIITPTGEESQGNYLVTFVEGKLTINKPEAEDGYALWIGNTQVTNENKDDVLGNGTRTKAATFIFNPDNHTLVISNETNPYEIESRLPELKIFLNDVSKLKRIYYNNLGNTKDKGSLIFTCDDNFPGKITLTSEDGQSVISGFSSVEYEFELSVIEPEDVVYENGALKGEGGSNAVTATVGQVIKPLVNNQLITFHPEDFIVTNDDGTTQQADLSNYAVNDILYTLNTNEDGEGFDGNREGAIVLITPMTDAAVNAVAQEVENESYIPGGAAYAENFTGLTFMVPAGDGMVYLDLEDFEDFDFHLKIGTGSPISVARNYNNKYRGTVAIPYQVDKATYVYLYLVDRDRADTRIGKREKSHGTVFSLKVSPYNVTSTNPVTDVTPSFPPQLAPQATLAPYPNPGTGIRNITGDNTQIKNKWFTLDGQRIDEPKKKGIYIQDRKKVIIK